MVKTKRTVPWEVALCEGGPLGFYGATFSSTSPVRTSCLIRASWSFKVTLIVLEANAAPSWSPLLSADLRGLKTHPCTCRDLRRILPGQRDDRESRALPR